MLGLDLGSAFVHVAWTDDTGTPIASAVGDEVMFMLGLRWGDGPVPYTHRVARLPFDP